MVVAKILLLIPPVHITSARPQLRNGGIHHLFHLEAQSSPRADHNTRNPRELGIAHAVLQRDHGRMHKIIGLPR